MNISVIVPVYNVEPYLCKCLDSILNQTYKKLEIILVDDGSKDRSGDICEEYKLKDDRIIVVHKENGGLSSARNAGLEIASGDLVGFIDSDDWIEPNFFEILYKGITQYNADISVIHFKKVKDFSNIDFISNTKDEGACFNREEAMKVLFASNFIGYSAWNKLYKMELFNNIRFPEGKLMEDKATTYKLIHKSKVVVVNESQKYHYFLRSNSIIRSRFNERNFDAFIIHEEIIDFIDLNYPKLANLIRSRYVYTSVRMLMVMIANKHQKKKNFEKCTKVIRRYIKFAVTERELKFSIKLLAVLFSISPAISFLLAKSRIVSKFLSNLRIS